MKLNSVKEIMLAYTVFLVLVLVTGFFIMKGSEAYRLTVDCESEHLVSCQLFAVPVKPLGKN